MNRPGNKGKREKLLDVLGHLSKRVEHMRYNELRKSDLDIATGPSRVRSATSCACGSTVPACAGVAAAPRWCCTFAASCSTVSGMSSLRVSRVVHHFSSPLRQFQRARTRPRRGRRDHHAVQDLHPAQPRR